MTSQTHTYKIISISYLVVLFCITLVGLYLVWRRRQKYFFRKRRLPLIYTDFAFASLFFAEQIGTTSVLPTPLLCARTPQGDFSVSPPSFFHCVPSHQRKNKSVHILVAKQHSETVRRSNQRTLVLVLCSRKISRTKGENRKINSHLCFLVTFTVAFL